MELYRNNKKNLYFPGIPGIPGILKIIFRSTGKSKGREIENPNRILLYVKDFKHDATTNSHKSKDLRKKRRRSLFKIQQFTYTLN